jgi:hypothetical protein
MQPGGDEAIRGDEGRGVPQVTDAIEDRAAELFIAGELFAVDGRA